MEHFGQRDYSGDRDGGLQRRGFRYLLWWLAYNRVFFIFAFRFAGVGGLGGSADGGVGVQIEHVAETFRKMFSGPIIVNTGFDKAKANAVLASDDADLVAFGVPYIANPDLAERLRIGGPLNKPDPSTFYGEGPKGYTDYPAQVWADAAARNSGHPGPSGANPPAASRSHNA